MLSVTQDARGRLLKVGGRLVVVAIILFILLAVVAQPYDVPQGQMRGTLLPQDAVLVDKVTPRFDAYKRGDIVVFGPPDEASESPAFIERLIALSGETVDLLDGHVLINGQELNEPYVFEGRATLPIDQGPVHWLVPAGALFVLGDNRTFSVDSRHFGPIPIGSVIGRVWLRYWPLGRLEILQTPTYSNLSPAPSANSAASR